MTVARASTTFGRTVLRRTAAQTRSRAWRQLGRRQYASAEHAKKSSDLPWMIGSVVATVPAAIWLIGQAPKKSDHHGPSHGKEHEEEEPAEASEEEERPSEGSEKDDSSDDAQTEKTEDSEDESKDDKKDESKDEQKDESKDDSKDESKDEDKAEKKDEGEDDKEESSGPKKDKDGYELPGPNAPGQINWKPSLGKGPGEGQKASERKPTEKKGEKDAHKDYSGAQNPYLDDDEKSKKGEGLKDTMKIHGTVDSNRPLRGAKESGKQNDD